MQTRAEAKLVWIMPSAVRAHLHNKPCEPMPQAERKNITITAKNSNDMGYFSLDIKKAKGTSDTTQSDHIERKIIPKNADPTRTHLNRVLVKYPDGVHGRDEAIAHRLNTAGIRRKSRTTKSVLFG